MQIAFESGYHLKTENSENSLPSRNHLKRWSERTIVRVDYLVSTDDTSEIWLSRGRGSLGRVHVYIELTEDTVRKINSLADGEVALWERRRHDP